MKATIYFMTRAPIKIEQVDRIEIVHGGALYRLRPQLDALGVRLDQPLGDSLICIGVSGNGLDLMHASHDLVRTLALRETRKARKRARRG